MARGDHQAEVRNVCTGRMRIPGQRQAADDVALLDGDVDGGIRIATDGLEVATLVCDGAPRLGRQQPVARFATDRGREGDELACVGRLGRAGS